MLENTDATACRHAYETLLCWVLVDPFQRHGFCRLVLMHSLFSIKNTLASTIRVHLIYVLLAYLYLLAFPSLQRQPCRL
jgi:cytochrome c oxidase subunit IV